MSNLHYIRSVHHDQYAKTILFIIYMQFILKNQFIKKAILEAFCVTFWPQ